MKFQVKGLNAKVLYLFCQKENLGLILPKEIHYNSNIETKSKNQSHKEGDSENIMQFYRRETSNDI